MRIIIAPDSFKGSLSAARAAEIMARACRRAMEGYETVCMPVADGGEGTLEAIVSAAGGEYVRCNVTGPLWQRVEADFGLIDGGNTAVIEMAQASGITLAQPGDPVNATSYGTGELIRRAINGGAKRLLVGIGGSATNDGGMGMLSALGAVFRDERGGVLRGCGGDLEKVASVDASALPKANITVICDVTNPLLGANGATYVYGPQKGAEGELKERLEAGMSNYARVMRAAGFADCGFSGAGAAGGVGYALGGVMGARLLPGIDAVLDAVGFERALEGADMVLTGEGRLDSQSVRYGKVPAGVARRCRAAGIPVIAIAGSLGAGAEEYLNEGMTSMETLANGPLTLEYAMKHAGELLEAAVVRALSSVKCGMRISERRDKR